MRADGGEQGRTVKRNIISGVEAVCIAICAAAGCYADTAGTAGTAVEQTGVPASEKAGISGGDAKPSSDRGWWTREGIFYDGTNLVRISFRSTEDGYEENTWFANGVFGDDRFFSGNVTLTEEGLEGTVKTGKADGDFFSGENRGTAEVRISEDGIYSIVLAFGTDEEYHLTLLTELEP